MTKQQRRKADSTAPLASAQAIDDLATTLPGEPANDAAPTSPGGYRSYVPGQSPVPSGFVTQGYFKGLSQDKLDRVTQALKSQDGSKAISIIQDLNYDPDVTLELSVTGEVQGDCLLWTFRGDVVADGRANPDA